MKKLFICALALASVVACSKDDTADVVLTTNQKSVAIKIANAVSATRNGGDTAAGSVKKAATPEELKVWFADGSGIILEERALTQNPVGEDGSYMFHQVSEQVQNIAVGRYEAGDLTAVGSKISDIIAKAADPEAGATTKNIARPIETIILSSDMVKLEDSGETCTEKVGDATYEVPVYEADVTVTPRLSRVEISLIQCDDLGYLNTAAEGDESTYGFDELKINSFKFGNNTLSAINNVVLSGSYAKKDAEGNWVAVTGEAANSVAPTNVWSWNLKGGQAFETMVLDMTGDAKDWTVNDGHTTLTINSLKVNGDIEAGSHADKCACGFGEDGLLDNYLANHIYNMEIVFGEGDLDPRNTAICVNVTVTVAEWVVVPVTPNFGK